MTHSYMVDFLHCGSCNMDVDVIEVKHHTDYEERILNCGHTSNKHITNIVEPPIHISDKITATVSRFKQLQRLKVEERVINGKLSMQFSADKIELVINDSIINVNAQDDYTFTRSFPQTEDIINKITTLRYEVEKSSIDKEKEKTVSLQFAKHLFGVRPFSNPQNNTTQIIITVVRVSFTFVLYVQVAIFL
jgi:hypothetical protein